jgi:hypothetical protein
MTKCSYVSDTTTTIYTRRLKDEHAYDGDLQVSADNKVFRNKSVLLFIRKQCYMSTYSLCDKGFGYRKSGNA